MRTIRDSALREIDQLLNDLGNITPGRYRRYRIKLEEADAALAPPAALIMPVTTEAPSHEAPKEEVGDLLGHDQQGQEDAAQEVAVAPAPVPTLPRPAPASPKPGSTKR